MEDDGQRETDGVSGGESHDSLGGNLGSLTDIDFSTFDLDAPVPPISTNAAKTTTAQMFAGREHQTLREIAGTIIPSLEIVGSPATAADQMEAVMAEVGGDGFLVNSPVTPRAIADIAGDLAPELRRRGLIRSEYSADTLRGNLTAY